MYLIYGGMMTTTVVVDFLDLPPKYGGGNINFKAPQWTVL